MSALPTDGNLLFGILALQLDFIGRDDLIAAMSDWVLAKDRPLGQLLVERGALDPANRDLLETLVARHLACHGGDPSQSLAALRGAASARDALATFVDLDVPARPVPLDAPTTDRAATPATFVAPASGMRFRILRLHARGGLGQVYLARDEELGRPVALKEIQPEKAANPTLRARFVLEAEINGNLEHPGIVPVYGLGTYDDGRPYYAMRFIEGDSLKDAIERFYEGDPAPDATARALRLRQLLGRFVDVCEAIAYAHSRGVLHRDLKPANIMLGPYGETLIIDWGLAKATGRRAGDDGAATLVPPSGDGQDPTLAGSALGTPAFMSPEQAEGRLDRLGPATDIYGLGATLYALLTGRPPVSGEGLEEILTKVRSGAIVPPRRVRPSVPHALEAVCRKALALRPEDRYGSARALAEDIEHWLADEPVTARRDPVLTRLWRWVRKHRTLTATAAATALVALIALALAYRRESRYADDMARANTQISRQNATLTETNQRLDQANRESERWLDEAFQAIEDYYTDVGESVLRQRPDLAELRRKLLERPRTFYERLAAEYAARPDDEQARFRLAGGRLGLGRIDQLLGRLAEAAREHEQAAAAFRALADRRPDRPAYRLGLAAAQTGLGLSLRAQGKLAEAAEAQERAIRAYQALVDRHPENLGYRAGLAGSHNNLGSALTMMGRVTDAAEQFQSAIAEDQRRLAREPRATEPLEDQAGSLINLAAVQDMMGHRAESLATARRAIATYQALLGREPGSVRYRANLAHARNSLGLTLHGLGRFAEAAEEHRRAIVDYRVLVQGQPNVPDFQDGLARSLNSLGNALGSAGQGAEAAPAYREALERFEAATGTWPDLPMFREGQAMAALNLGNVLLDPDQKAATFRRAIASYRDLLVRVPQRRDFPVLLGGVLGNLGRLLALRGQPEEAIACFREALDHLRPALARRPGDAQTRHLLSTRHAHLARLYRELGRPGEAAEATRQRIALWPGNPVESYNAACEFARCLPIARDATQRRALGDEAMAALRAAVAAGWADATQTAHDPDLDPLRDRVDLRRLLDELHDREMPTGPFAP